jgi:hypothetical protein
VQHTMSKKLKTFTNMCDIDGFGIDEEDIITKA